MRYTVRSNTLGIGQHQMLRCLSEWTIVKRILGAHHLISRGAWKFFEKKKLHPLLRLKKKNFNSLRRKKN